ncbi:helix-turn-helix domain-containing protein [Flavobacterium cyclinae]|uniref:helix-turn-helix domain-containing protein n=1 Tax=Flavobacterium cyclinae TaxID=2895947 RepID=UPI001E4BE49B|nr:helix-turn-helix domain-containing protein [Flavobacterium cyclinae]UGS22353.1 AraC family transcriptional regulator [Flavobacterium cyclinae]
MSEQNKQERIRKIYQMLFEMASGNLQFQIANLDEEDEIDQIALKLNEISSNIKNTFLKLGHVIPQFTYQNLVQHTFILDKELYILSFSSSVLDTLKLSQQELSKLKFSKIIAKQSINDWKTIENEIVTNNIFHITLQLHLLDKNNQIYPSYFTISSLLNSNKIVISGITTNIEDYTNYNIANNNLASSKKIDSNTIVQNVYNYIMNHLEEPLPSVNELAKMFGTNDFRLKAEFRKHFNISIYKCYTNERLKRATYLIKRTNIPLKEIAFISGFNDYNNFSKAFKKKYNYVPSELQRSLHEED